MTVEVAGASSFPTNEAAWDDDAPDAYVMRFRDGETVFTPGPNIGTWEVVAYGVDGGTLWSVSTAIWNSETFSEARTEARDASRIGDDYEC